MKLVDLDPAFVDGGGGNRIRHADGSEVELREGIGLSCQCPCGCGEYFFVHFQNPIDGHPYDSRGCPQWERTGATPQTLTLKPSIQRHSKCNWHGYLTDGVFQRC